ncbi:hypothetical protein [Sphingomonas sp. HMP6]|uniref:hypothetical protein n=1 Tax=Sphingomonas sp. HMP6 TaxID=1517551 RepID=UPI0015971702|nr:hypothetical protein [Sphingomonas sp. HMP6]BCA60053.1 hypothetical protein HMP06_2822 [Sphingomonas sp. HMP6]
MATHAPITGAPTRAPNFHALDLSPMDDLSGDLSILKSLIDISIDTPNPGDAENLLHAALRELARADARHQAFHQSLLALKREG